MKSISSDRFSTIGTIELLLDKCKFYPQIPLAVLAGSVISKGIQNKINTDDDDDNGLEDHEESSALLDNVCDDFQNIQPQDRCLIYYKEPTGHMQNINYVDDELSPTIHSLMERWGSNECGNSKCTGWIPIAVPFSITCHIVLVKTEINCDDNKTTSTIPPVPTITSKTIFNNTTKLSSQCWVIKHSYFLSSIQDQYRSTMVIQFWLEQSKLYSTKLMVLQGTIDTVNLSPQTLAGTDDLSASQKSVLPQKGQQCKVKIRSNVQTFVKQLKERLNGSYNGTNILSSLAPKNTTGWMQYMKRILITCQIYDTSIKTYKRFSAVDDNTCIVSDDGSHDGLTSSTTASNRTSPNDVQYYPKKGGIIFLECQKVIDIQIQDNDDTQFSTSLVHRLTNRSYKSNGTERHDTSYGNSDASVLPTVLPVLAERKERHYVFARWLIEKFGIETLSKGTGVLDVAGGKGELCQALLDLGVRNTMLLDPNPRCDTSKVQFQVINRALIRDGSDLTNVDETEKKPDEETDVISNSTTTCDEKLRVKGLVQNCSFIAGMHPDQATEAIIVTSLRLGVPFALLPCCFSRKFSMERLDRSGDKRQRQRADQYQSYGTFCQYLMDMAPFGLQFHVEHLPFQGRNKVIYFNNYACQMINKVG